MRQYATVALVVFLAALLIVNQRTGLSARQRQTCEAINQTKAALVNYIDQQIARSSRSLPTIQYYKKHPVELGRALADLQRQREETHLAFAQTNC